MEPSPCGEYLAEQLVRQLPHQKLLRQLPGPLGSLQPAVHAQPAISVVGAADAVQDVPPVSSLQQCSSECQVSCTLASIACPSHCCRQVSGDVNPQLLHHDPYLRHLTM